jgi:histidine triad (HIT) family protein
MHMQENCLFCKIIAGQLPGKVVYQDEDVFAIEDIYPQAPQHILLMPREHIVASMAGLTPEHGPLLTKIFMAANRIAQERGIAETGYRFVTNSGPQAGQAVFHLHFHLLGGAPLGHFGVPHRRQG